MTDRAQIVARLQRSLGEVARAIADLIVTDLDPTATPPPRGRLPGEATPGQVAELLSLAQTTLETVRGLATLPAASRTMDGDRMMSKREAARILGVSRSTLWVMEKQGLLAPVVMRGHGRYRESQLTAFMNSLPSHEVDGSRIPAGAPKRQQRGRPPKS